MKTAQEIYTEYNILPTLQLHQLRVAAVGKMLCEHSEETLNIHDVITACLFHDMGNIIKSDLSAFPEFLEPKGLAYWQSIKDEYVRKYGTDHHEANTSIAKEIGFPEGAYKLLAGIGFSKLEEILKTGSSEQQICEYSDLRVGPHGVLSMRDRLDEGRKRYARRNPNELGGTISMGSNEELYQARVHFAEELERKIFSKVNMTPDDITDSAIENTIEELRKYSV